MICSISLFNTHIILIIKKYIYYVMKEDRNFSSTREGFSVALFELAKENEHIVVLTADLEESLKLNPIKENLSKQFYEMGICEQNMASAACGMAKLGKLPFICSYAVFSPGRNWDQIRVGACYSNLPIVIVGGHSGLTTGKDGATHQALEDIAITRVLPNMQVFVPSDGNEAYEITKEISKTTTPVYLRLNRISQTNNTYLEPFSFQRARLVYEGNDCLILATGTCVEMAFQAATQLELKGVYCKVLAIHSIKPLDIKRIVEEAKECGCVVSCEEHQIYGGFSSAISEVLSQYSPMPQEFVGVQDTFGESADPEELLNKYKISTSEIIKKVQKVILRKINTS